jgi:hypothetical protein
MTTTTKVFIGLGGALLLSIPLCCGGFGLLFHKSLENASVRAKAEEARPQPSTEHYEQIATGMTEEQVDKLLGMPSASDKKSDGSLVKTWNSQSSDSGPIRVTFNDGKATAKVMDDPLPEPPPSSAVASSSPASSPPVANQSNAPGKKDVAPVSGSAPLAAPAVE